MYFLKYICIYYCENFVTLSQKELNVLFGPFNLVNVLLLGGHKSLDEYVSNHNKVVNVTYDVTGDRRQ